MPLKKVVRLIRGEQGTEVRLTILKGSQGVHGIPRNIKLARDKVKLTEQEAKGKIHQVEHNGRKLQIGVIELTSFYIDFAAAYKGRIDFKSSTRDVKKILDDFNRKKVDGVLIDLRRNGGGSLIEAINLTGLFINEGPVVQVRQHTGQVDVKKDRDKKSYYDGPLGVLCNRLSASAAEIFAGAIKDYRRGILMGDQHTHGKGTVQSIIELDPYLRYHNMKQRAGSVKITTAKFYRINGDSTQQRGVDPNIVFPSFTDIMDVGEKHLDHVLPWNAIKSTDYKPTGDLLELIPEIKKRTKLRQDTDKKFQILRDNIALFKEIRDRKRVTLNEAKRWARYERESKLIEQQNILLKADDDDKDKKEKKPEEDLYLNESIRIICDMIELRQPANPTVAE